MLRRFCSACSCACGIAFVLVCEGVADEDLVLQAVKSQAGEEAAKRALAIERIETVTVKAKRQVKTRVPCDVCVCLLASHVNMYTVARQEIRRS